MDTLLADPMACCGPLVERELEVFLRLLEARQQVLKQLEEDVLSLGAELGG